MSCRGTCRRDRHGYGRRSFDVERFFLSSIANETTVTLPLYVSYILLAYDDIYAVYEKPSDVFRRRYVSTVHGLFDMQHFFDDVLAGLPSTSRELLRPSYYANVSNNANSPLRVRMRQILLAVLALVVVNALAGSPWGVFSIAMTIPIALFMGFYMRVVRPGAVVETSIIGVALLLLAIVAGGWVSESSWAEAFTLSPTTLVWCLVIYGFLASVLPVWMLLAPRDYLSTFMKIGTIVLLAVGVVVAAPHLQMPATTVFTDGSGPVFSGALFPFVSSPSPAARCPASTRSSLRAPHRR